MWQPCWAGEAVDCRLRRGDVDGVVLGPGAFEHDLIVRQGYDNVPSISDRTQPRVGAGNSAVVVDLPRWGPMLSPRVPNLVPIPGPRKERETPWSAPTTELWASTRWDNPANGGKPDIRRYKHLQVR